MGSEPFGPFAIEPAWRRRGPMAEPFAAADPPADLPVPVRATATPVARATVAPFGEQALPEDLGSEPAAGEAPRFAIGDAEMLEPVRVNPPPPEDLPAPSPFKPDPAPRPHAVRRTRRRWRLEGLVAYLAAAVGLIALGGAVWLDRQNQERFAAISSALAGLEGEVQTALAEARATPAPQPAPANDGTIDALLALQTRIAALEETARAAPDPIQTAAIDAGGAGAPAGPLKTRLADGPTKDCIPLGTHFVMTAGDSYPICRTPEVIKLTNVTMEGVVLAGGTVVMAGSSTALKFGECSLAVLSTDMNGFAELEATCS